MTSMWCALAVVGAVALAAVSPAYGAFPGENGKIAFFSDRDGDLDIWTMEPNGHGLANLTAASNGDEQSPNWRADGRKIAFMSNRVTAANPEGDFEIFVMSAGGSHPVQLTSNGLDDEVPAWSPDGSRITFHRDFDPIEDEVDTDLFTMKADGADQRNLTNSPGVEDREPNWSADGRSIAFVSDRDGDFEVFTMRPGDLNVRQLTFNDALEFRPNWSPDSRMIGFASDQDGDFEVFTMRADGTGQRNLTDDDAGDGLMAWAPDGSKIVFNSDRAGGVPDVFTMRADGSHQVNRTENAAFDFEPDWQPLGRRRPGTLAAPAGAHHPARSDAVAVWNANAGRAAVAACISPAPNPLHESRLYAMTHVAIHDTVNAIDRRSEPYAFAGRAQRRASLDAAVAAAARGVMVPVLSQQTPPFDGCIGAAVARVESDYATALAQIPDGVAKTRGVAVGRRAAAAIVTLRAGDGADTALLDFGYIEGSRPGEYRFTPGTPFAFAPGWAAVTPFVLRDASQFRSAPPYDVTGRKYAADLNEVKQLGSATSESRTADQTEIARFWVESSPLQWNRIARTVAARRGLDPWEQARLFGLLNLALADGYIGSFETKYRYRYWRPVTAIHAAGTDGNPDTHPDPDWTPLEPTPAIPDHDSAHSVEGGAAAAVMKRVFGTDHVAFSACSSTLPAGSNCDEGSPVFRHYSSFSQAANENALSRILVGFHFRKAVEDGVEHGRRIGERAADRFMRPGY